MAHTHPNDVVLTGPPRSGSTLACVLLNRLPDTVALDEPLDPATWLGVRSDASGRRSISQKVSFRLRRRAPRRTAADGHAFAGQVGLFFADARRLLLADGAAVSMNVGGVVSAEKFPSRPAPQGRPNTSSRTLTRFDKALAPDFTLCVKHNMSFLVHLEAIAASFRVYAIVRNPLAMLASWSTLATPLRDGRVDRRVAWADPLLVQRLGAERDRVDRQLLLLDWMYEKIARVLPGASVIRYEEIVATRGHALAPVSPHASELVESLEERNRSRLYDRTEMRRIGERILAASEPAWRRYYSVRDVEQLAG